MSDRLTPPWTTARQHASRRTTMTTWLRWLTVFCALLIGSPALSQTDNLFANSRTSFGAETFLPVDQAFRLRVYTDSDHLWLHWHAEPGYYLYEERFGLVDEQGCLLMWRSKVTAAGVKITTIFARDMHVYYDEALFSIRSPTFGISAPSA